MRPPSTRRRGRFQRLRRDPGNRDFDPERATLRSGLYGISRRVIAQRERSRRRAVHRLTLVKPPIAPRTPHDEFERRQAADLIARFVEGLDDKKRPVFILAEIEQMSAPEIAQCLDLNLNTVYSRLRLARAELRRFSGVGRDHGTD